MRPRLVFVFFLATLMLALTTSGQEENWHRYTPMPTGCQERIGPGAADDGTIGADFVQSRPSGSSVKSGEKSTRTTSTLEVVSVIPNGPADNAGIRIGDDLMGQDGQHYAFELNLCELRAWIRLNVGKPLSLFAIDIQKAEARAITLEVKKLGDVEHDNENPSLLSQDIEHEKGFVALTVEVQRFGKGPIHVILSLDNRLSDPLTLTNDNAFLLDASSRQVQLSPYAQWKFERERLISQFVALLPPEDESGLIAYKKPSPPPPPSRYRITGTEDGSYTVTPLGGNNVSVTGDLMGSYKMEPEYNSADQMAAGLSSIGVLVENIRILRINKQIVEKNKQMRQQILSSIQEIKQSIANGEKGHFDTSRPIVPGETRTGEFLFAPSDSSDLSSLRLVFALANTETGKDEFVTFAFRR